ncbi:MAG: hypothetical protein HOQ24_06675 [Mycobacteriaceae bacterium]|nr:hypothetical protein [Mycobacteriaceae bacterium]
MIWAGIGYDSSGGVVSNLDRHRVQPVDHRRPTRIIRTGRLHLNAVPTPVAEHQHEPTPGIARRQIVIRRAALRPTGT